MRHEWSDEGVTSRMIEDDPFDPLDTTLKDTDITNLERAAFWCLRYGIKYHIIHMLVRACLKVDGYDRK